MKKSLLLAFLFFFLSRTLTYAAGDFEVNFHVPSGQPIFTLQNMKPGDQTQKTIDVKNTGNTTATPRIKGTRTGGVGSDPKIEHILSMVIKDGNVTLYGPVTVEQFFADSTTPTGIGLSSITKNHTKSYTILVTFPALAGNEYQAKSVLFDLLVDTFSTEKIVINEVFYHVDKSHWHGLVADRRDDDHDLDEGGWYRDWFWQNRWWVSRKDFQWIELYNPTDKDINVNRWMISDKDNSQVFFGRNDKIKAHGFALLSKDDSLWRYWNIPRVTTYIDVGRNFGNGLDPKGDHLILRDDHGIQMDTMSWGTDTSGFIPPATNPLVPRGSSTGRISNGQDTDTSVDWHELHPPTPGR